jgi:transketolase
MVLARGTDVTIIASGLEVAEALRAARELAKQGVSARVVDMFTVKPLDTDLVERCARKTGAIVTAENHNRIGGLGSAVAEAVCDTLPVPVVRIGSPDCFGEVGSRDFLAEKFGVTAKDIVDAAKAAIAKKR